jgi:hypothetical protein
MLIWQHKTNRRQSEKQREVDEASSKEGTDDYRTWWDEELEHNFLLQMTFFQVQQCMAQGQYG